MKPAQVKWVEEKIKQQLKPEMNLKGTVDRYLLKNWLDVDKERKTKGFRWDVISAKIQGCDIGGEYIRGRYRKLKDKIGIATGINGDFIVVDSNVVGKIKKDKSEKLNEYNSETATFDVKYYYNSGKEDKTKGTKEWTFTASEIPSEEQIVEHFNIDTKKWKIVNIYHKTSFGGKYSITVQTNLLKGQETINLDQNFIDKLSQINPLELVEFPVGTFLKPKACLLIPKQDVHWNKFDIDGKNFIEDRFSSFTKVLTNQLEKAQATNKLEKIIYIVGSDEFNSEWTLQTTKGTPQQNILSYQEAFEKVSEYTIELIKLFRYYTEKVEVVLLNGNHDHNVSWHLANLLKHVFSKNTAISIDTDLVNTKVLEYSSSLILVNHGDEMKPKDLASKFPIIAKDKWSNFENYFVISGDKHHELAHDFNGVRTFQVPQLSTSKSLWDDKKGHVCSKPELITFLFEEDGLSNILRKQIK